MTPVTIDKIKGVFFGQAIGDALGLGTEFMTKKTVKQHYPNGLSEYSAIIQDAHRKRWAIGDWTDDTDQFLCIVDSIIQSGNVDEIEFAKELYRWFKDAPMGIGQTVYRVLSMPQFTLYPHRAAEMIWRFSKKQIASNGAIMRTSILGTYDFWNYASVERNTTKIARVTHWDSRCAGSCVIVSLLIAHLLKENDELDIQQLISIADTYDDRIKPYIELAYEKDIALLQLDEPTSIGYTLKALSAGLWGYINATNFEEGILEIIHEGGDADTNACIAGSILGAKFGYHSIPKKYIDGLLYRGVLEEKLDAYLSILNERFSTQ